MSEENSIAMQIKLEKMIREFRFADSVTKELVLFKTGIAEEDLFYYMTAYIKVLQNKVNELI